jgi:multidrug resistance efflux pump
LDIARQQIALARAQLWAAQARRDATEAGVDMPLSFYIVVGEIELGPIVVPNPAAPEQFDVNAAEASVSQAESSVTIEQLQHDQMEAGARAEELAATRAQLAQAQARVQMAQVQLEQAQQAVNAAETQVRKSQAQLELTLAGAKAETISVAEAKVAQARADVATLEVQREKLSLRAPMDGLVTERMVYEGETVVVGARLFVLSTLDPVILTIYVPENRIGRVRVGQAADLSVDAYPGRTFHGEVVHIASQAEFTPRNIQTREEQTTTVFAVRIKIPNPERTLKPGMTADATIR